MNQDEDDEDYWTTLDELIPQFRQATQDLLHTLDQLSTGHCHLTMIQIEDRFNAVERLLGELWVNH